jgi:hypothetical protein
VPAAAVIPAPIAYIKVVAVKKLVVEFWIWPGGQQKCAYCLVRSSFPRAWSALHWVGLELGTFTLKKLECSKQAYA